MIDNLSVAGNMNQSKHTKVAIFYKYLPQYRQCFFDLLRQRLLSDGIELTLVYGQPGRKDALKKDAVDSYWGEFTKNRLISLGNQELIWQPVLEKLSDKDLIIVEQASKLLVNYIMILLNELKIKKVAFWGHGRNFQAGKGNQLGEVIKRFVSTKVHWWFAYNEMSAQVVRDLDFPTDRITIVQNAIDTHQLSEGFASLTQDEVNCIRQKVGITGNHIGLYVGGMYSEKRLDFLEKALVSIRSEVIDFEMVFIGGGAEAFKVKEMAKKYSWVHYLGPKFDNEKIPYFAMSKLFLMPGLVGLAILDCFAMELPLVTTQVPYHSPEIEYLKPGINGVMVEEANDPEAYARAVVDLLINENQRQKLTEGCRISKSLYTVEEMVERFAIGVQKALNA